MNDPAIMHGTQLAGNEVSRSKETQADMTATNQQMVRSMKKPAGGPGTDGAMGKA